MQFRHATLALAIATCSLQAHAIPSTQCRHGTWVNLTSLPTPRQEHTTVALNKTTVAVLGGITRSSATEFNTTDSFQLYDIPSATWRDGPPIPLRVNHPNAIVSGGKVYLLGGLVDGPVVPPATLNWLADGRSYMFDPQTNEWSTLETMPPGMQRGSAVMGAYGEVIYVAGGMTLLTDGYQDTIDTVIGYNITSGHWQRLVSQAAILPEGREHAVGSVVGETFYLLGGRFFSQAGVRGTVFELNLKSLTAGWRTSPGHMPTPRGGLSGNVVGQKWYTFGGEGDPNTPSGVFPQSEVFDTKTQKWTELKPMAVPRHGTHSAAIGNMIFIPGGGLQQDGKPYTHNGTTTYSDTTDHFDAYCV